MKKESSGSMSKKRFVQVAFALFLFAVVSALQLWHKLPTLLYAQEVGTQDGVVVDGREQEGPDEQEQIFLPFIVESDGAIEGDGGETEQETPAVEPTPVTAHDHGQPLFESWPPQPVGISAVAAVAAAPTDSVAAAAIAAAHSAMADAEALALASGEVQAALGTEFVHATTVHSHPKGATAASKAEAQVRVAYFSYSNNSTVEATVEKGALTGVTVVAANLYQPEPTAAERTRAAAIARAYFLDRGESRVNALQGYVIMAYRSQGTTGFYDARVLYVTFHENLEERPEYLAWVNLSTGTVLRGVTDSLEMHAAQGQMQTTPQQSAPATTEKGQK